MNETIESVLNQIAIHLTRERKLYEKLQDKEKNPVERAYNDGFIDALEAALTIIGNRKETQQ